MCVYVLQDALTTHTISYKWWILRVAVRLFFNYHIFPRIFLPFFVLFQKPFEADIDIDLRLDAKCILHVNLRDRKKNTFTIFLPTPFFSDPFVNGYLYSRSAVDCYAIEYNFGGVALNGPNGIRV